MLLPLASSPWPDVPTGATVLVPVGSVEQHGPHLPLDTDTVIAVAVAQSAGATLAKRGFSVLVAPPIAYTSSGEHQDFPGTASIGTSVLCEVLVELTRSLTTWASRVVFVNAHGGNVAALREAVPRMRSEGHDATWVACATENVDLHAGRTETSLMLHLAPDTVRVELAEAGNTAGLAELLPLMIKGGVKAVSANGVLGDPAGASADEGAAVLASMVQDVVEFVADRFVVGTETSTE